MALQPDLPLVEVVSRGQWRVWLAEHHHQSTGVWAVTGRGGPAQRARQSMASPLRSAAFRDSLYSPAIVDRSGDLGSRVERRMSGASND
jgi:hypothetical protein